MSTCGSNPLAGGRRRRSSKKSKKTRGGAYGFGNPITVGALEVSKVDTSTPVNSETGGFMPDPYANQIGGRRHRRSRRHGSKKSLYADIFKGGRKRRTTRRRKLYGGANQMIPGNSSAGFTGAGVARGMGGFENVGSSRHNDVVPLK